MAFDDKNQSRLKKIIIIVVCVVLALAMTLPSVALMLNRGGSSSDGSGSSTGSTTTTGETMKSISDGYVSAFADLKTAQSKSSTPDIYDATFVQNYDAWSSALYKYAGSNTLKDADDINGAFDELVSDIKATRTVSTTPKVYDECLAYAYYVYAFSLKVYSGTSDVDAQLSICYTEGINYHNLALEDSYSASTAGDLATMLYWQGNIDEAITTVNKALEAEPDNAICWYNLGNYYYTAGQYEKAREAYQKALDVDPDDSYGVKSSATSQLSTVQSKL